MYIDCPYFDFIKVYPYHYMLMVKYDALLRKHGFGIWVRDTDHTYNSVRWGIGSDGVEANDKVKKLSLDFAREFYSTCEKCGNRINNSPYLTHIENNESCFYGAFDDEGFICDECKANVTFKKMVGYGTDIGCWLDCITRCSKSDDGVDKILLGKIQRHKMMFTDDDGRVGYCRFADIREHDGQWYLIASTRDKASVGVMENPPFEMPSGCEC